MLVFMLLGWWQERSLLHLATDAEDKTYSNRGAEHSRASVSKERQVLTRLGENAQSYGYMYEGLTRHK